ncbi:hypothetical protein [Streptosporangium vulgare]|uniref:hypothetical protein n=1 Tax=Streptosporangium vulgare TaxID=46190 RepID=UPI0031D5500F
MAAIIRNTEPLPKYYRIEYDLKTLDFGGLRNGSLFYDGKYNGYTLGECRRSTPGVGDPNDIDPADPCATRSVREDSNEAYNAFHFMSILDFPAMPGTWRCTTGTARCSWTSSARPRPGTRTATTSATR